MTALSTARATSRRDGIAFSRPCAASKTFYPGAIVMKNASGYATPGATATGCIGLGVVGGRTPETVVSSAVAGAESVEVEEGVFLFGNSSSGDAITIADVGNTAWIVDDQTVAKTNGSSSRSPAGVIVDVGALGVWVRMGLYAAAA